MNRDWERLHVLFPALGGLPPGLNEEVHGRLQTLSLPAGTRVFDDGQACQALPLVLQGNLRVSKRADSGREIGLYRVMPGEVCIITLGCLLGGNAYPATGVAESPVSAMTLPRAWFMRLVAEHAPYRQLVFDHFAERLSGLMQLVEEVALKKLDQRLAAWLVERGPVVRLSHQAIAEDLGSVREIVSRLLGQFADQGWVRLGRERVEVLEPGRLLELAG